MNITGRVEVMVNGEVLLNKEGAIAKNIGVSGKPPSEKEPVLGDGGLHGFKDTPMVAECEVTVTDREDISLSDILAINGDGTVVFRARGGGKVYTMSSATSSAIAELTAGEGETRLKFMGPSWVESTG